VISRIWQQRLALGFFGLGFVLLLWSLFVEPARLVVQRTELELQDCPPALAGLKVALLADIHIGSPHWDLAALDELVARTNAEKPDIVMLAGDYQINGVKGGTFVPIEPIAAGLGKLRAPLGVVAVLGNHDWWNDGERSRRALTAQGIRVLENEALRFETKRGVFYAVGLADQLERHPDPVAALAPVEAGAPTLLLVHEPDVFETFPRLGVRPQLTLAGHTHGGQVWLPLLGRRVVPSEFGERYAYGHIVEEGRDLFVTGGVGTSIIPVRFLVPPEIAILSLRAER
jgi:predicted MPP superfamily phosphohydrolase